MQDPLNNADTTIFKWTILTSLTNHKQVFPLKMTKTVFFFLIFAVFDTRLQTKTWYDSVKSYHCQYLWETYLWLCWCQILRFDFKMQIFFYCCFCCWCIPVGVIPNANMRWLRWVRKVLHNRHVDVIVIWYGVWLCMFISMLIWLGSLGCFQALDKSSPNFFQKSWDLYTIRSAVIT